ncbi:MAG: TadE family protein [bacterium]
MLKKPSLLKNKNGQAMIEFLPAILLFIVILIVSTVFFMGLRESTLLQEAARNAAFAKISNSGPLVSRDYQGGAPTSFYAFPMTGTKNIKVSRSNTCFVASPQLSTDGPNTFKLPSILGVEMGLQRIHKMTIFRQPGDPKLCQSL